MAKRKATTAKKKAVNKSKFELLQERLDAGDVKVKEEKLKAGVPAVVLGLYEHLVESGTGKDKLDFLLSLDFGKEKIKSKIAEAAALAFEEAGYSLSTIRKIVNYAKKAGSK